MKSKVKTIKKTFLIQKDLAEKLNLFKNKSAVVNEWLRLFLMIKLNWHDKVSETWITNFEFKNFTQEELDSLMKDWWGTYNKISDFVNKI